MPEQSYRDQLRERQKRFTRDIGHLIAFAYANDFEMTFGEAYRTKEQQELYYAQGLSKTKDGQHPKRLAVDFNIFFQGRMLFPAGQSKEQYIADLEIARPLGEQWMAYRAENRWGGDWNRNSILDETFRDPYHFEVKF